MRKYIVKRLLISVFILICVTLMIYILMRNLPTSYVSSIARQRAATDKTKSYQVWLDELEEIYHMKDGYLEGYVNWAGEAVKGNFGESWHFKRPVTTVFREKIWYSVVLNIIQFILHIAIAIPLGIKAAVKQYSRTDYMITFLSMITISFPTFFLAEIMKYVFSTKLGWFPLYGMISRNHEFYSPFGQTLDVGYHYILPVVVLVFLSIGGLVRYTRTNMLEVLSSDYIRTARAKGVAENKVINYHAFRNTLIPVVTILGGSLPSLFSGAMITETLFQIEGIGYTSYQCMTQGDVPFTMFYLAFMSVLTLVGLLIQDILYAVVDPRVRIS
ncbi:MAG: ABC transporter permease [Saccharofermentanales bacterium]|jgi:peptide/nickel transport system permease protein|nr:ABC transporter permease [Bacillota bacterium]